jgi:hypothetical protein
MVAIG